MSNPLETLKSFVGLNNPDSTSTANATASSKIEPTSHPIAGETKKTELQPSAPAVMPAKLAVDEIEPADGEIAMVGDAEAGVSLNEVIPVGRGS